MQLSVEFGVVLVYFVVLLTTGFLFQKRNSNVNDFFRSGAQGSWWLIGASIFMANVSTATFTGNASVAYDAGLSITWIYFGAILGLILNGLFMAAWFRQLRAITFPEIVRERYGQIFQQFFAYSTVLLSFLGSGMMLWAMGVFCSAVTGAPILWTIVVLGVIVTVYSCSGGSWAVFATDFLQSLILLPVAIIIAILCLVELGGVGGFISAIRDAGLSEQFALVKPEGMFEGVHSYSNMWITAFVVFAVFNSLSMTFSVRYFAARDGKEAKKAAWFVVFLSLIGLSIWFIPPMAGRLLYAEEIEAVTQLNNPADAAYAITAMNLLPNGMLGLLLIAMFAASMSTIDSGVNRNAAILVRDILPLVFRALKKELPDDQKMMRYARGLTLLSGTAVMAMALYFATGESGMFEIMMLIGAVISIPLSIPLILGMFVKRAASIAAFMSICFAAVPAFFSFLITWRFTKHLFQETWGLQPWSYEKQIIFISLSGVVGFALGMPFYPNSSQNTKLRIDNFFTKMHTPIDYAKEVGVSSVKMQLMLLGKLACATGLLISLLVLVPNPLAGRLIIGGLSLALIIIGTVMLLFGHNTRPETVSSSTRSQG